MLDPDEQSELNVESDEEAMYDEEIANLDFKSATDHLYVRNIEPSDWVTLDFDDPNHIAGRSVWHYSGWQPTRVHTANSVFLATDPRLQTFFGV